MPTYPLIRQWRYSSPWGLNCVSREATTSSLAELSGAGDYFLNLQPTRERKLKPRQAKQLREVLLQYKDDEHGRA
jgi:hypothetical protein